MCTLRQRKGGFEQGTDLLGNGVGGETSIFKVVSFLKKNRFLRLRMKKKKVTVIGKDPLPIYFAGGLGQKEWAKIPDALGRKFPYGSIPSSGSQNLR
jgi:hypothetical protein